MSLWNKIATRLDIYRSLMWQINFLNDGKQSEARHTQAAAAGSGGRSGGHQHAELIN